MTAPTLLGHVGAVTGATVSVRQYEGMSSGIAIIGGRSYRVGQVGSFVRIPQGYHDLYGIIADVGATAAPSSKEGQGPVSDRWMTVQLVGEIIEASFERGISQYPSIKDEVHLVTEEDLAKVYGAEDVGQVVIGRLAAAESIPVRVSLDKLVTRHSAVLGSTGSGKSTTVASLLQSIAGTAGAGTTFPSARILLLDLHGEYAAALKDVAKVFAVGGTGGAEPLHIPFWAMDVGGVLEFLMGKIEEKALTAIYDKILEAKGKLASSGAYPGADPNSLTLSSPLPYSLHQLWFDLIDPEVRTTTDNTGLKRAIEIEGDANALRAPKYHPAALGAAGPFLNKIGVLSIKRQLSQLRSRLLDRQYDFMLHPGDWEPNLEGKTTQDLDTLLEGWIGHEKPITILDLSGIPSAVLEHLIGGILNVIYEGLFWGRELPEGARKRPQLVVMEEAHRYLSKENAGPARAMVQRIVKEGRKFGVGAMIVSQRPSEIDETILSQCGTFFALRLSNASDRAKVQGALADTMSGIIDSLPVLRTGEAIVIGEAARLPIRCRVTLPAENRRPDSRDPEVSAGWKAPWTKGDYKKLAAVWRAQDPRWQKLPAEEEEE